MKFLDDDIREYGKPKFYDAYLLYKPWNSLFVNMLIVVN